MWIRFWRFLSCYRIEEKKDIRIPILSFRLNSLTRIKSTVLSNGGIIKLPFLINCLRKEQTCLFLKNQYYNNMIKNRILDRTIFNEKISFRITPGFWQIRVTPSIAVTITSGLSLSAIVRNFATCGTSDVCVRVTSDRTSGRFIGLHFRENYAANYQQHKHLQKENAETFKNEQVDYGALFGFSRVEN